MKFFRYFLVFSVGLIFFALPQTSMTYVNKKIERNEMTLNKTKVLNDKLRTKEDNRVLLDSLKLFVDKLDSLQEKNKALNTRLVTQQKTLNKKLKEHD